MVDSTNIRKTVWTDFLGLRIDEHLSFEEHIDNLSKSLVKFNGIFYRLRDSLPPDVAIQLYNSLVHSKICYGVEIYGMARATALRPLQVLQNRILKTATFKHRRYPTNTLHKDLAILKVSDIQVHVFKMSSFTYKYVNNILPCVFSGVVNPRFSHDIRNRTRNNSYFSVSRHHSEHGKLLLNNYCYKTWKAIPNDIQNAKSHVTFKRKLKAYLIGNYDN